MSCGNPHETPCSEVIEQVYFFLDGEINSSVQTRIRVHLDECGPCLRQYGLEQEVKALVHRCCGAEAAPEGLRESVLVRLHELRIELREA